MSRLYHEPESWPSPTQNTQYTISQHSNLLTSCGIWWRSSRLCLHSSHAIVLFSYYPLVSPSLWLRMTFQQLWDGLLGHFVQTFIVQRSWITLKEKLEWPPQSSFDFTNQFGRLHRHACKRPRDIKLTNETDVRPQWRCFWFQDLFKFFVKCEVLISVWQSLKSSIFSSA